MADLSQHIPNPSQIEALVAGFQRVGRIARDAADNMVEAFAAAGRQLEQKRLEQRQAGFQRVSRAAQELEDQIDFFIAARRPGWELAEARREAQWHRQQEKDILRQQLDRDSNYFGRKRRWRRARGRRIEAKRAFLGSLAQRLEPLARGLLFHQQQDAQSDD